MMCLNRIAGATRSDVSIGDDAAWAVPVQPPASFLRSRRHLSRSRAVSKGSLSGAPRATKARCKRCWCLARANVGRVGLQQDARFESLARPVFAVPNQAVQSLTLLTAKPR
jgi:hypothetical protein